MPPFAFEIRFPFSSCCDHVERFFLSPFTSRVRNESFLLRTRPMRFPPFYMVYLMRVFPFPFGTNRRWRFFFCFGCLDIFRFTLKSPPPPPPHKKSLLSAWYKTVRRLPVLFGTDKRRGFLPFFFREATLGSPSTSLFRRGSEY